LVSGKPEQEKRPLKGKKERDKVGASQGGQAEKKQAERKALFSSQKRGGGGKGRGNGTK